MRTKVRTKSWRHYSSTVKMELFLYLHPDIFCGLRIKNIQECILKFLAGISLFPLPLTQKQKVRKLLKRHLKRKKKQTHHRMGNSAKIIQELRNEETSSFSLFINSEISNQE